MWKVVQRVTLTAVTASVVDQDLELNSMLQTRGRKAPPTEDVHESLHSQLLQTAADALRFGDLDDLQKQLQELAVSPVTALHDRAGWSATVASFEALPGDARSSVGNSLSNSSVLRQAFLELGSSERASLQQALRGSSLEFAVAGKEDIGWERMNRGGARKRARKENECTSATCQRLEVLWVRHGHGCHNAIRHQGAGFFAQARYPDPFLTNCGKIMTERNGEKAKEILDGLSWSPEHVFSSALLRAIETATIMFPGSTVQPLPFVGEKGFGLIVGKVNTARTPEEQQSILPGAPLDYRFLPDEEIQLEDKRAYFQKYSALRSRKAASHKAWRAFFGEQVMPELLQGHDADLPLRVAVVSHAHFIKDMIRDFFFCSKHKPQNNEAVLLKYDYNPETKKLFEVIGADESPDDACGYPLENEMSSQWHEEYLCLKDYDNCYEYGGREVMKVDDATGESRLINDAKEGQMCCSDQP